jgi:hypothetical protein
VVLCRGQCKGNLRIGCWVGEKWRLCQQRFAMINSTFYLKVMRVVLVFDLTVVPSHFGLRRLLDGLSLLGWSWVTPLLLDDRPQNTYRFSQ